MPKSLTLGNGNVLVGFDQFGQVNDFYFHYAGLENHVSEGLVHKIGVWVEDEFSWLDDSSWEIDVKSNGETMASLITAKSKKLGLILCFKDVVYNEKNIFIREVTVENFFDRHRLVKIYFNQQFNISQTHTGDTAYYDPRDRTLIHYKGRRVFLINTQIDDTSFTEYGVGLLNIEGKAGTYKDAEDGQLSGNSIEHGQVDSVLAVEVEIEPKSEKMFHYWIAIGKSLDGAKSINEYVMSKGPDNLLKTTSDYWKAWVNNQNFSFYGLGPPIIDLFKHSLIAIRTHVNKNGSIIASCDSDMLQFGRDTYGYVWPRDAAFSAIALAKAGDLNASKRLFEFCNDVLSRDGYFMHKYRPDKSLGSSWHPWVRTGTNQLPIQEDETALIIYALWTHFKISKDLEFIEEIYNSLIKKSAEFMVSYKDKDTGLPKPSYDLWEEKYGVSTFTASSVYAALNVASRFAKLLGKEKSASRYLETAQEMKKAILSHLYDEKEGIFYKQVHKENGKLTIDKTVDMSSIYGIFKFDVLPYDDERVIKAIEKTQERLEVHKGIGGIARYEGDAYRKFVPDVPGNPWVITTMWLAQFYIQLAQKDSDFDKVHKRVSWAVERALNSGVLAEQFHPVTGAPVSAAPLTWSHAEYVMTIIEYLEKLEELGICKACYPIGNGEKE